MCTKKFYNPSPAGQLSNDCLSTVVANIAMKSLCEKAGKSNHWCKASKFFGRKILFFGSPYHELLSIAHQVANKAMKNLFKRAGNSNSWCKASKISGKKNSFLDLVFYGTMSLVGNYCTL